MYRISIFLHSSPYDSTAGKRKREISGPSSSQSPKLANMFNEFDDDEDDLLDFDLSNIQCKMHCNFLERNFYTHKHYT